MDCSFQEVAKCTLSNKWRDPSQKVFVYAENWIFCRTWIMGYFILFHCSFVAVTDLFPLVNQCPTQAIRLHIDQSGAERIHSFFFSRSIFSDRFWKLRQVREHLVSSQDRPLSHPLLRTFHMDEFHRRTRCY